MEPSGSPAPLHEERHPIEGHGPGSSLDIQKATTARSDKEVAGLLNAYSKAFPWPTDDECTVHYRENFRLAFNIIATSSFKHDRLAAEALMALYSSSTSLRALNLRFQREFEDCNARGHPLPPYLVAWVQVKRLADEADSRREFLPQDPSEYAYFRHIPYSIASPYEATAIAPRKSAQTPQFHAKSATPLGSISSNKTVPRPSFHPSLWEAETGGAEMVRGNGDNKVHHGTRINKKNSYNGDAGSLNEAGKRINGAPGSDKGRVAKSSKRLHTGRISNYVVQNEKHNRFVASQGKPITKEALDAGFAGTKDRERYEKHLQKNRNHARSRGIHYAPSSGYYQNYPGYGGLYSPSSQLPTTSNPGPPMFDVAHPFPSSQNLTGHAVFQSPGANFLQSPPNQFLQFNQFYPRNNVVAQVQVQQGTPIPPNEYAQNQPVLDKYGLSHSHPTGAHAPYLHSPPNRH